MKMMLLICKPELTYVYYFCVKTEELPRTTRCSAACYIYTIIDPADVAGQAFEKVSYHLYDCAFNRAGKVS